MMIRRIIHQPSVRMVVAPERLFVHQRISPIPRIQAHYQFGDRRRLRQPIRDDFKCIRRHGAADTRQPFALKR